MRGRWSGVGVGVLCSVLSCAAGYGVGPCLWLVPCGVCGPHWRLWGLCAPCRETLGSSGGVGRCGPCVWCVAGHHQRPLHCASVAGPVLVRMCMCMFVCVCVCVCKHIGWRQGRRRGPGAHCACVDTFVGTCVFGAGVPPKLHLFCPALSTGRHLLQGPQHKQLAAVHRLCIAIRDTQNAALIFPDKLQGRRHAGGCSSVS